MRLWLPHARGNTAQQNKEMSGIGDDTTHNTNDKQECRDDMIGVVRHGGSVTDGAGEHKKKLILIQ